MLIFTSPTLVLASKCNSLVEPTSISPVFEPNEESFIMFILSTLISPVFVEALIYPSTLTTFISPVLLLTSANLTLLIFTSPAEELTFTLLEFCILISPVFVDASISLNVPTLMSPVVNLTFKLTFGKLSEEKSPTFVSPSIAPAKSEGTYTSILGHLLLNPK